MQIVLCWRCSQTLKIEPSYASTSDFSHVVAANNIKEITNLNGGGYQIKPLQCFSLAVPEDYHACNRGESVT